MAYKSLMWYKKGIWKVQPGKKEFLVQPKQFSSVKSNNWVNFEFISLTYRNMNVWPMGWKGNILKLKGRTKTLLCWDLAVPKLWQTQFLFPQSCREWREKMEIIPESWLSNQHNFIWKYGGSIFPFSLTSPLYACC